MVNSVLGQVFDIYLQSGPSEVDIRRLNNLLSTSKTFEGGLQLLKSLLTFCKVDFLNENLTNWLDYCLLKHAGENLTELKMFVIEKFLEASLNNQELSKKISSDYLSKIIEFCLQNQSNQNELLASLSVLIACMKKYNNWFINHKAQIEVHILSLLETSSDSVIEQVATSFLYLQQVGNAGTEGINHRNNFKISLQKLCASIHNLFDIFMENSIEIDHIERPKQDVFTFEVLSCDPEEKLNIIAKQIKNVIKCLTVMIQKGFIVYKEIIPNEIINVIRRGTMTHHCISISSKKSLMDYQFCLLLNDIQVQLLYLLRVLILWLQNSSFPFSFFINNILINCLKRSQKCKCFSLSCVYQETLYIVLKYWLIVSKSALNSNFQVELITCLLKDISPIKSLVTLKVQPETTKKQGVKRKITQNSSVLVNQTNNEVKSKYEIEKDELKCQMALETLKTLFYFNFLRVDKQIIHDIYTLVMSIFNEINTAKIPHPYASSKSQLKLHELLVSFYEQETLKTLPFISLSLNILNNATCSNSNDVVLNSKIGLNSLEKLCQPISSPFLTFSTLQMQPVNNKEQIIGESEVLMECITDITEYNRTEVNTCNETSTVKDEINSDVFIENSVSLANESLPENSINDGLMKVTDLFNLNENEEKETEIKEKKINILTNQVVNIQICNKQSDQTTMGSSSNDNRPDQKKMFEPNTVSNQIEIKNTQCDNELDNELNSFVDEVKED